MTGRDPGDVPAAGDPEVSRVLYALRDLCVEYSSTAARVLDITGGAGLTPAQREAVLAAFPRPPQPPEAAGQRWRSYPIPGPGAGGSV